MDESVIKGASVYTTVVQATADVSKDTISNPMRYLPPMHAIVLKKDGDAAASVTLTLNTSRVVTSPAQVDRSGSSAPRRAKSTGLRKGIMTVTALNPVSPICTSRLLIGQGYHKEILEGEDAVLTTICIDDFSMVNAPATPFNIYAAEGNKGLCINLRDSIVNVPISFYLSELPYDPVTRLWFTGVNNIDGQLWFYDALTDKERPIIDGMYIDIETPEINHEKRYYIRCRGFKPGEETTQPDDVPTGYGLLGVDDDQAVKIFKDGNVLIIRKGHVYTMIGQQLR
jgi:hypothetical protein